MGWICTLPACVALAAGTAGQTGTALPDLDRRVREVAALPGEPSAFESMGVTRTDAIMRSIESREAPDMPRRRVVLLGGLDGNDRGTDAVLGAVRWWKTAAPAAMKESWSLSAVPCGNPEGWLQLKPTNDSGGKPAVNYPPKEDFFRNPQQAEGQYLWRWLAFQAPDLVLDVRGGNRMRWYVPPGYGALAAALQAQPLAAADSLGMALSRGEPSGLGVVPALVVDARASDGPALLQAALRGAAGIPRSPMRKAVVERMSRPPLEIASLLARKYPETPSVTYIPAVAWSSELRLARLSGDMALREKVRQALAAYLSGARPALEGPPDLAKLAGHLIFADLALEPEGDDAARKLALDAAAMLRPEGEEPVLFGRSWTDDMFFSAALLGRAGRLSGEATHFDLMARTLAVYAQKLQRADGLFVHAPDAPHCWGRGNGFAALGLAEALMYLPAEHPRRAAVLEAYRKQMAALKRVQAPDGTWRQVIDRPESYREVTATAMNLAAMARGVRLGWLDPTHATVVDRAWSGLTPRISGDGGLVDVCAGTGAGPTLRYYYERPAVSGSDDRGGAMCLLAAVEMAELRKR